ncbi:unnamed protein product [Sphagnum jensenii]|uniref:SBP-type domain-containing protein n=1 Tax=Sphagnum jensenii TaxID=128206 RepID=A0ABP1B3T9_9BRYO
MNSSANTNEHQGDSNWSTENWDNTGAISSALEHASRQYTTNRLEWEWDPMILAQHPGSDGPNEVGDGDHKSQITAGQMSSLRAYNNTISTGLPATFTQNALGIFNPAGMWNYGALDGSGVVLPLTGHLPNSLGSGIPGLAASSGGHHENIQTALDGQHHNQYLPSGMHKNHLVKREDVSDGHNAPCIGLNLGVRTYFSAEDTAVGRVAKRHRAGSPGTQIPMCQAEGCKADLSTAKHYHRRHKVCELHSKTPTVIAAGRTQRFCQQCSRFHLLAEFDEGKRSCRRRLADHNRRRRKQQPSAVSTGVGNSAEIASIRHGDEGDNGGVVSGKLPRVTTRYSVKSYNLSLKSSRSSKYIYIENG